jgi:hypothetical protein
LKVRIIVLIQHEAFDPYFKKTGEQDDVQDRKSKWQSPTAAIYQADTDHRQQSEQMVSMPFQHRDSFSKSSQKPTSSYHAKKISVPLRYQKNVISLIPGNIHTEDIIIDKKPGKNQLRRSAFPWTTSGSFLSPPRQWRTILSICGPSSRPIPSANHHSVMQ